MPRYLRSLSLVVLAGTLLLVGCSDSDDDSADATTTTVASTAAGADGATTTSAPDDGTITVVVADGDVVEGSGRHDIALGDTVRISVTSDSADEVHVHGYDELVEIEPGVPAVLEFTADIPGVFEVELEGDHQLLLELQVQ